MNPKTWCRRAVSCLSLSRLVSTPLILTMPDVGVSMHPIMLRIVDLPDPEGPVIEMNSPFSTVKETPRTACTSVFPKGYTLVTSTSSTMTSWSLTMSPRFHSTASHQQAENLAFVFEIPGAIPSVNVLRRLERISSSQATGPFSDRRLAAVPLNLTIPNGQVSYNPEPSMSISAAKLHAPPCRLRAKGTVPDEPQPLSVGKLKPSGGAPQRGDPADHQPRVSALVPA